MKHFRLRLIHFSLLTIPGSAFGFAIMEKSVSIGFDFGTSGVRAVAIGSADRQPLFKTELKWHSGELIEDMPNVWLSTFNELLDRIPTEIKSRAVRICLSGTSSTCMLVDTKSERWKVKRGPFMYNYNTLTENPKFARKAYDFLEGVAPPLHTTLSGSSALMKLLTWHFEAPIQGYEKLAHQADFIAAHVRGNTLPIVSDWNNALKTGYDVEKLEWPEWIRRIENVSDSLPTVVQPGEITGRVGTAFSLRHNVPRQCEVVAGTTDSIAAYLAAGANELGQGVTSLGSSLAIKLLSTKRIEDSTRGVYSHRLGGDKWLVGGSSNVGSAVFRQLNFTDSELRELSEKATIDMGKELGYIYYPIAGNKGERFPCNDPNLKPIIEPVPDSRKEFMCGLFHSIARIEKEGYDLLHELGAEPKVVSIKTSGGGAQNDLWTEIRARKLGIPVEKAVNTDPAYGVALLGLKKPLDRNQ